jgi:hypothetical protein
MVATMALALLTSVIAGDPRFLLAKDGIVTGSWGLWVPAQCPGRRPAALVFARPLMEHVKLFGSRSWDRLWDTEPQFRRIWRVATVMWGAGLLADAAVRVVISYMLPVDAVPAIGGLLYPVTFVVLQVAGNIYFTRGRPVPAPRRALASEPERRAPLPGRTAGRGHLARPIMRPQANPP